MGESLLVDRPAADLYRYWRDVEHLPRVLAFVERVERVDEHRARWTVPAWRGAAPAEQWDARLTEDVPDERIAWRLRSPSGVEYVALVRFTPGPRGTGMRVELLREGADAPEALGEAATARVRTGLRDFKRTMEAGEALTTADQSRGSCGAPPRGGAR